MGQGKGATTRSGILLHSRAPHLARFNRNRPFHVPQLADIKMLLSYPTPAEEDVRRALQQSLPHDHAFSFRGISVGLQPWVQHRGLGLLDLQDQWVLVI